MVRLGARASLNQNLSFRKAWIISSSEVTNMTQLFQMLGLKANDNRIIETE